MTVPVISIHSVIEENVFWEIVGDLRTNGAEGILGPPYREDAIVNPYHYNNN